MRRNNRPCDPIGKGSGKRPTGLERILGNIVVLEGCWEWTGNLTKNHYAHSWIYREVYEWFHGSIKGELDHTCTNRSCINPDHLEDVSTNENIRRMHLLRARLEKQQVAAHIQANQDIEDILNGVEE